MKALSSIILRLISSLGFSPVVLSFGLFITGYFDFIKYFTAQSAAFTNKRKSPWHDIIREPDSPLIISEFSL